MGPCRKCLQLDCICDKAPTISIDEKRRLELIAYTFNQLREKCSYISDALSLVKYLPYSAGKMYLESTLLAKIKMEGGNVHLTVTENELIANLLFMLR